MMTRHSHLRVLSGFQAGMVFPLVGSRITLGREPKMGIMLIDPLVSRCHAQLSRRDGELWIEDLGSTNGTFVNGERLTKPRSLEAGDEVRLGVTAAVFEPVVEEVAAPPAASPDLPVVPLDLPGLGGVPPHPPQTEVVAKTLATRQLMTLLRWSERLHEFVTPEALAHDLSSVVLEATGATRAVVLLRRIDATTNLVPMAFRRRRPSWKPVLALSQSLLHRSILQRSAVLSSATGDGLADEETGRAELGSVLCVPMIHQSTVWGAVHLDTLPGESPLTQQDLALATGIGHQSAAALAALDLRDQLSMHEQRDHEIAFAREIQERQLPSSLPDLPAGWSWAAISRPARVVGGDYYDAWALDDGRLAVALGDVTGKGVPAALMLAAMRAYLRAETTGKTPESTEVVTRLNHWAHREAPRQMYMSLIFGILNPHTHEFVYTNAGHHPPLVIHPNGRIQALEIGGMVLGVRSDEIYQDRTIPLHPGETLLLYTDGVTDVFNARHEKFGEEGVIELAQTFHTEGPDMICRRLWETTQAFAGEMELADDFTAFAIRVGGAEGKSH